MTTTGRVHSWDLSTGVDGPGTRFVLFLSGCPLRCLYCANPDTWHMRDGKETAVEEVMAEIEKYRAFITTAGGGVTLTGGEPLLQSAFTGEVLPLQGGRAAHRPRHLGFPRCPCLRGTPLRHRPGAAGHQAFDIDTYRKLTGGELAPTLSFATRLGRLGVPMWIRYVLVPGWTDDEEAVECLARFVAGLGTVDRVDVLPFHKLGTAKYDALGLPFPVRDTPVPAPGPTERVRARFGAHGLSAY
jgi:pyruvate formate lyase activating enzyme